MLSLHDILGTVGVLFTLIAYFLLNIRKLSIDGYLYTILNAIGSIFIIESLMISWNFAAFLMEAAWLAISLYALYNVYVQSRE